jgi:RNA polymerase sigma-70 factor, ECF subfamily
MSKGRYQAESTVDIVTVQAPVGASDNEIHFVNLLRHGDEAAFISLVEQYHTALLRLAMAYIPARTAAEEVVQETWMAVLEGIDQFEGRSSLKTWLFRILTNRAKTRAQREGRSIPFSSLPDIFDDFSEPAVDPDRFLPADHTQRPGQWVSFPSDWQEMPEERLLSQETLACINRAIERLQPNQREIIILRDILGWTSEEACTFLGISEGNQRVLLHRARSKVRSALEKYFEE